MTILGSEKNVRIAIREFIAKYMDTPVLMRLYEENELSTPKTVGAKNLKNHYELLSEEILNHVGICFASIPDERISRLTEDSYAGLVLHVAIAIERVQRGEIIESNVELLEKLKNDEEYNLALLIVNSLEDEFGIEIPDIEIAFICLHIKGSKLQKAKDSQASDALVMESDREITELVQEMIIAYDEQMAYVLSADEDFVTSLLTHIRQTIVRLRNNLPIENPHLEEIKTSYPEVYQNCLRVGKLLEATLGYDIPEPEIGFLAIHFGAAMVRLQNEKEKIRTVSIGLVCASGIGISRLMASRLKMFLKERAKITTYGKSDLTPFVLDRNDFFVSSIDLREIKADVLEVSPLLPEEDLLRIDIKVKEYEITPLTIESDIDFDRQLEQINDMAARVKEILRNFFCRKVSQDLSFTQLVEAAASYITPYEESRKRIMEDIRKREDMATQVIPELEIALLHARVTGIFQMGFYVCVPDQTGIFLNPYLQSVRAAIVMLIPDDEWKQENSMLLGYLSENLIEDDSFLEDIKSGDETRIKNTLTRLLKNYFSRFIESV